MSFRQPVQFSRSQQLPNNQLSFDDINDFYSKIRSNDISFIQHFLLNSTANIVDQLGNSPLHVAIQNDADMTQEQIINLLQLFITSSNGQINTQNSERVTPLHLACQKQYEQVVKFLVDTNKIDPNLRDKFGRTALHYLIIGNQTDCSKISHNKKSEKALIKTTYVNKENDDLIDAMNKYIEDNLQDIGEINKLFEPKFGSDLFMSDIIKISNDITSNIKDFSYNVQKDIPTLVSTLTNNITSRFKPTFTFDEKINVRTNGWKPFGTSYLLEFNKDGYYKHIYESSNAINLTHISNYMDGIKKLNSLVGSIYNDCISCFNIVYIMYPEILGDKIITISEEIGKYVYDTRLIETKDIRNYKKSINKFLNDIINKNPSILIIGSFFQNSYYNDENYRKLLANSDIQQFRMRNDDEYSLKDSKTLTIVLLIYSITVIKDYCNILLTKNFTLDNQYAVCDILIRLSVAINIFKYEVQRTIYNSTSIKQILDKTPMPVYNDDSEASKEEYIVLSWAGFKFNEIVKILNKLKIDELYGNVFSIWNLYSKFIPSYNILNSIKIINKDGKSDIDRPLFPIPNIPESNDKFIEENDISSIIDIIESNTDDYRNNFNIIISKLYEKYLPQITPYHYYTKYSVDQQNNPPEIGYIYYIDSTGTHYGGTVTDISPVLKYDPTTQYIEELDNKPIYSKSSNNIGKIGYTQTQFTGLQPIIVTKIDEYINMIKYDKLEAMLTNIQNEEFFNSIKGIMGKSFDISKLGANIDSIICKLIAISISKYIDVYVQKQIHNFAITIIQKLTKQTQIDMIFPKTLKIPDSFNFDLNISIEEIIENNDDLELVRSILVQDKKNSGNGNGIGNENNNYISRNTNVNIFSQFNTSSCTETKIQIFNMLLLMKSIVLDIKDNNQKTPLEIAISNKNIDIIKEFVKYKFSDENMIKITNKELLAGLLAISGKNTKITDIMKPLTSKIQKNILNNDIFRKLTIESSSYVFPILFVLLNYNLFLLVHKKYNGWTSTKTKHLGDTIGSDLSNINLFGTDIQTNDRKIPDIIIKEIETLSDLGTDSEMENENIDGIEIEPHKINHKLKPDVDIINKIKTNNEKTSNIQININKIASTSEYFDEIKNIVDNSSGNSTGPYFAYYAEWKKYFDTENISPCLLHYNISRYLYNSISANKPIDQIVYDVYDNIFEKYISDYFNLPLEYEQSENLALYNIVNIIVHILKTTLCNVYHNVLIKYLNKYFNMNKQSEILDSVTLMNKPEIVDYIYNELPLKLVKIILNIYVDEYDADTKLTEDNIFNRVYELISLNQYIKDPENVTTNENNIKKTINGFYKEYFRLYITEMKTFIDSYYGYILTEHKNLQIQLIITPKPSNQDD